MIKIATVVGARPQFVKAAALSRAFLQHKEIEEFIIHTGQHYDEAMSDVFFSELEIPRPRYNLGINKEADTGLSPSERLGKAIEGIAKVLEKEKPQWVLIYGDTDSTLAGALAAAKSHIPLIHVEAGLRSYNEQMPEELNRVLSDRMSKLLFCPSDQAIENLKKEGFGNLSKRIFRCGDLMQDAAFLYENKAKQPLNIKLPNNFILCTIHRVENTSNPTILKRIFSALDTIAESMPLIIPLHPGTRERLGGINYGFASSKIHFIEPVSYLEMVFLLKNCRFVMTDSGGVQKEAYFFRKMCLTLREETEWTELVENKCNILTGTDPEKIIRTATSLLKTKDYPFLTGLYGNGDAAQTMVRIILQNS